MAVLFNPPVFAFTDDNGNILAGGKVYSYKSGTSEPLATYSDDALETANTNPVELNAAGRPQSGAIYLGIGEYKFIVKNASGIQIGPTMDPIHGTTSVDGAQEYSLAGFDGDLDAANDAVTDSGGIIIIDDNYSLTGDLTLTCEIKEGVGVINLAGHTLTCSRRVRATTGQLFDCSNGGNVIFQANGVSMLSWGGPLLGSGHGAYNDKVFAALVNSCSELWVDPVPNSSSDYYETTQAIALTKKLVGRGYNCPIKPVSTNQNGVVISSGDHAEVNGIRFIMHGTFSSTTNGYGIYATGSNYVRARNIHVENSRGGAVCFNGVNDGEIDFVTVLSSPVTDSDNHSQVGTDIFITGSSSRNRIKNIYGYSGNGFGIQVLTTGMSDVCNDNVIDSVEIDGYRAYGIVSYAGAAVGTINRTVISNARVRNISGATQHTTQGFVYGAGIYIQGCEDCTIKNFDIYNTHSATVSGGFIDTLAPGAIGTTNLSRVTIETGRIEKCGMYGITVRDPNSEGAANGIAFIGGVQIYSTAATGVHVKRRGRVKIQGISIDTTSSEGIWIDNDAAKLDVVSITSSRVKNVTGHGIKANNLNLLVCNDNVIEACTTRGALFQNIDFLSCNDNVVRGACGQGFDVDSTVSDGTFDNNSVIGDGSVMTYCFVMAAPVRLGRRNVGSGAATAVWTGAYAPGYALPNNDTTPTVKNATLVSITNSGATTITDFDDGYEGQEVEFIFTNGNSTIDFTGTNLKRNQGTDWTPSSDSKMRCVRRGTKWYCDAA